VLKFYYENFDFLLRNKEKQFHSSIDIEIKLELKLSHTHTPFKGHFAGEPELAQLSWLTLTFLLRLFWFSQTNQSFFTSSLTLTPHYQVPSV